MFRIDHVGIVVRDIHRTIAQFATILGVDPATVPVVSVRDPETGEQIQAGFITVGPNRIEFICPPEGSVSRFARHLEERGESLFHLSLYVEEFAKVVDAWGENHPPLDVLTVEIHNPGPDGTTDRNREPDRIVDIAWIPPEFSSGINVELVDAHPTTP